MRRAVGPPALRLCAIAKARAAGQCSQNDPRRGTHAMMLAQLWLTTKTRGRSPLSSEGMKEESGVE